MENINSNINDEMNNKKEEKLMNKNFLLMLQGGVVSLFGNVLYSLAIGYYVYNTTGSEALMGILSSISMFMMMFLSPVSGAIIDRSDRKKFIVAIDLISGVLMLGIGFLCMNNYLNIPLLTLFTIIIAFVGVFYNPAISTILIDIVPKSEFVRANSIVSSMQSVVQLVSRGISGFLLIYFGVGQLIIFNGISYIFSALSECFINVPKTPNQGTGVNLGNIKDDLVTGFKAMFHNAGLRVIFVLAVVINLCSSGMSSLYLIFTSQKGFSVEQYGLMLSIIAVGSLIGAVLVSSVKLSAKNRYRVMCVGFILTIGFSILGYLAKDFYVISSSLAVSSLFSAVSNMFLSASIMLLMPEENRAACIGFLSASCMGGMALSTLIYGLLGELFPIANIAIVGSLISMIPMIMFTRSKEVKAAVLSEK